MAIFEWVCRECKIYWDRECRVGKAPSRTRCPECKKLCNKYWQNQGVGISFRDDGRGNKNNPGVQDFHSVRRRYQKFFKEGYDKDSANRFLHQHIDISKKWMDDESFRYKSAQIDYHKMAQARNLKKVGDHEAREKMESSRRLTSDAYDRANNMGYKDIGKTELDITKPNKNG